MHLVQKSGLIEGEQWSRCFFVEKQSRIKRMVVGQARGLVLYFKQNKENPGLAS